MNVQSIRSPIESSNSRQAPDSVELPSLGRIAQVQRLVANSYGIEPSSIRSRCNLPDVVWARQVAMYLCAEVLEMGLAHIGRHFDRNHATVISNIRVVKGELATGSIYAADVEALTGALR